MESMMVNETVGFQKRRSYSTSKLFKLSDENPSPDKGQGTSKLVPTRSSVEENYNSLAKKVQYSSMRRVQSHESFSKFNQDSFNRERASDPMQRKSSIEGWEAPQPKLVLRLEVLTGELRGRALRATECSTLVRTPVCSLGCKPTYFGRLT
eukprot:1637763-Pyramimonas_sp.AAC.2